MTSYDSSSHDGDSDYGVNLVVVPPRLRPAQYYIDRLKTPSGNVNIGVPKKPTYVWVIRDAIEAMYRGEAVVDKILIFVNPQRGLHAAEDNDFVEPKDYIGVLVVIHGATMPALGGRKKGRKSGRNPSRSSRKSLLKKRKVSRSGSKHKRR